jgi:hypothetical protein
MALIFNRFKGRENLSNCSVDGKNSGKPHERTLQIQNIQGLKATSYRELGKRPEPDIQRFCG